MLSCYYHKIKYINKSHDSVQAFSHNNKKYKTVTPSQAAVCLNRKQPREQKKYILQNRDQVGLKLFIFFLPERNYILIRKS